jgi:hypothetical protein
MAVSGEVKEVIEVTVDRALEKFEKLQDLKLSNHGLECPGRRVGKGFVALVSLAVAALVPGVLKATDVFWSWLQSQGQ